MASCWSTLTSSKTPVSQNICYHVAAFVILFNLICNMTMFWKSRIIPFEPSHRVWGGGERVGRYLRVKYLLHIAAFLILFNLICDMNMFWKSRILTYRPYSQGRGGLSWDPRAKYLLSCYPGGETQAFDRKSRLICFIFIIPLCACKISVKNINNFLNYYEI